LHVHRTVQADPAEVTHRHGLPVTRPSRTLLDLAEAVGPADLEQALAEAERRRLVRRPALLAYLGTVQGRRGIPAMRAALEREGGPAFTRSEAERRLLALVRAARLPPPRANASLAGYEVDFLWAREGVVVEVDGYAYHWTRGAFESDHRRDGDLENRGHRVIRFTWLQLQREPYFVVARLAGALVARAGARGVG